MVSIWGRRWLLEDNHQSEWIRLKDVSSGSPIPVLIDRAISEKCSISVFLVHKLCMTPFHMLGVPVLAQQAAPTEGSANIVFGGGGAGGGNGGGGSGV
jgi:hypothetical protein